MDYKNGTLMTEGCIKKALFIRWIGARRCGSISRNYDDDCLRDIQTTISKTKNEKMMSHHSTNFTFLFLP
jgi:hypothetical protein